eukprot:2993834-Rhodomonas_salina.2
MLCLLYCIPLPAQYCQHGRTPPQYWQLVRHLSLRPSSYTPGPIYPTTSTLDTRSGVGADLYASMMVTGGGNFVRSCEVPSRFCLSRRMSIRTGHLGASECVG